MERRLTGFLDSFTDRFTRRLTRRLDLRIERRLDLRMERLTPLRGFRILLRPLRFTTLSSDAFTLAILFQERIKKNYLNFRKKFPYLSVFDFFSERLSISLGKGS
jgi:hypothetical protein